MHKVFVSSLLSFLSVICAVHLRSVNRILVIFSAHAVRSPSLCIRDEIRPFHCRIATNCKTYQLFSDWERISFLQANIGNHQAQPASDITAFNSTEKSIPFTNFKINLFSYSAF